MAVFPDEHREYYRPALISAADCYNPSMENAAQKGPWKSRRSAAVTLAIFALVATAWLVYTPDGLLGKSDAVGYAVCHRIRVRSFMFGERQISMCARCTGMYLGALLGLAFQGALYGRRGGRPPWRVISVLGLITVGFGLDGINSLTNLIPAFPSLYTTTNPIRVFLGTGFGITLAAIVFPGFNQSVWRNWDPRPALTGLRPLFTLLALGAVIAWLTLTGNPLILYPLSLLSAVGVLLLLSLAYTMLVLMVMRSENASLRLGQLAIPLIAGLTLALLQIAGADLLRYALTGTWDGFHF